MCADLQGRKSYHRYLANKSVTELLQLYGNDSAAARRAVLRQMRLVNESLAQLDAVPPHPTVDDLYRAAARDDASPSPSVDADVDVPANATVVRPSRMTPPTASGWLPPLLHRHRRWTGNCVEKSDSKLTAWLAEPGKQIELPCVTWLVLSSSVLSSDVARVLSQEGKACMLTKSGRNHRNLYIHCLSPLGLS